jgi:hypothetical protein
VSAETFGSGRRLGIDPTGTTNTRGSRASIGRAHGHMTRHSTAHHVLDLPRVSQEAAERWTPDLSILFEQIATN